MNSARPALLLHLLSACALMAYTVVACDITTAPEDDHAPATKSMVDDTAETTPQSPVMEPTME